MRSGQFHIDDVDDVISVDGDRGAQWGGRAMLAAAAAAPRQQALAVDIIKQYPGPQQVRRAVQVNVPGKHFEHIPVCSEQVCTCDALRFS